MTYEIEQRFRPELTRNERLLWSGMPRSGLRWQTSDWFAVPFTLFWVYLMTVGPPGRGTHAGGPPLDLTAGSIPFVLVGFYVLVGRFFVDWYQRTRMYYGVTDQRIIILSGVFERRVKSLALATLSDIFFTERSNGSGCISFGSASSSSWTGRRPFGGINNQQAPNFDLGEGVREVYALIHEAQQADRKRVVV